MKENQNPQKEQIKPNTSLINSFNHAISGFVHSFKMERNMKYHVTAAVIVIIAGIITHVTRFEMIALVLVIGFVFFAELINTAVEAVVDLIVQNNYDPNAKIAKDVSAGAVFVAAMTALVVGYLVFFRKLYNIASDSLAYITSLPAYLTLAALLLVFLGVIMMKSRFIKRGGNYVQGGMPSGHTAFAFSLFTAITFISRDPVAATFAAALALIVAESRMETKVHSFAEVVMGALMGIVITVLVFQISQFLVYL